MRAKRLFLGALSVAALAWGPAAHALVQTTYPVDSVPPLEGSFTAVADPMSGVVTGAINVIHQFTDDFEDTFTFTLPASGFGSGSLTTSAAMLANLGKAGDLDFTSVTINGTVVPITRTPSDAQDVIETASAFGVPITLGVLNKLVVTGHSFNPSSYGGQITFVPTAAVPEPGIWSIMILGFGLIGTRLRSRRTKPAEGLAMA